MPRSLRVVGRGRSEKMNDPRAAPAGAGVDRTGSTGHGGRVSAWYSPAASSAGLPHPRRGGAEAGLRLTDSHLTSPRTMHTFGPPPFPLSPNVRSAATDEA